MVRVAQSCLVIVALSSLGCELVAGLDARTLTAGAGGEGGQSGTGGAPPNTCPLDGTNQLVDSFDGPDGPLGSAWKVEGNGTSVGRVGERMVFTTPAGETSYGIARSVETFDLRGCSVHAALLDIPGGDTPVYVAVGAATADDGSSGVYTGVAGNSLQCSYNVAGSETLVLWKPYEPAEHVWLRVSEHEGDVLCQTSVDGSSWQTQASFPAPFFLGQVQVDITAGNWSTQTSQHTVAIDDVNGVP